ncbi:Transmembrane protein 184C [Schistosoma japonicum]|nr:Transmembrane protein 184C [Schistosoma japonicum]
MYRALLRFNLHDMGWRAFIRPVFITCYSLLICIILPFLILKLYEKSAPAVVSAWFVAGLFVLGAIPVSLWTIIGHMINYTNPLLQRHIIRILWMVPIYAFDAWMALIFPSFAIYFDTLRECYEAYVIYNFLAFLLNYLTSEFPDLASIIELKSEIKHLPPFCFLTSWKMGSICEVAGIYGEGSFNFRHAFLYLTIINNVSQIWALYCLVMFYRCARQELSPMKPVAKFLCVKFVVFMSFW